MKGWMGKSKALLMMGFVAFLLSGCGRENLSVLQPRGESADQILDLINISIAVMIFVFLVVMVIYTVVIIKYRKKKGQEDIIPQQTEGNKALEIVWTVIPILLLVIIAIPTVTLTFDLADSSGADEGIRVDVVAHQFWWDFFYQGEEGEQMMTSQDLYIPTGEKVYLNLQSADVIHSFWVPALAGKMDVHVENENYMSIQANEEGVYSGKCAELCGKSHSLMDFKVIAVSPEEYEQWLEDMQNTDPEAVPETETAQAGQEAFAQSCISCHAVDTNTDSIGPNLANFGNRTELAGVFEHDADTITQWILEPESLKPGNEMAEADYELTREEAGQITEYLEQLISTDVTPESATSAE